MTVRPLRAFNRKIRCRVAARAPRDGRRLPLEFRGGYRLMKAGVKHCPACHEHYCHGRGVEYPPWRRMAHDARTGSFRLDVSSATCWRVDYRRIPGAAVVARCRQYPDQCLPRRHKRLCLMTTVLATHPAQATVKRAMDTSTVSGAGCLPAAPYS